MNLKLQIGNKQLKKDDKIFIMDVAPFTQNDRTMVPVRFVSEHLGYAVEWEEKTQTVTITDETRYFDTIDNCALDWAMRYNCLSIGLHKELGSTIYKDEKGYYYTPPAIGGSNNVVMSSLEGLKGVQTRLAIIHSHASTGCGAYKGDKISSGDIDTSEMIKKDNYMASPCGTLQVYRYATKKIELISDLIPFDRRALNKLQGAWKYGDMSKNDKFFANYNVGKTSVKADFYNELFAEKILHPLADD